MTQTRIHRFDFSALRDFRGPIVTKAMELVNKPEVAPAPPPPPVYSESDLEAARMSAKKQGYAEGFTAGQTETKKFADAKTLRADAALANLASEIPHLRGRYEQVLKTESAHLMQLITTVAKKVAGEAMNQRGHETILAIITQSLPVIFSKPKLVIEMNPELFEPTVERIETQLRNQGFEGEIQFKGNTELGPSDVKLDWGSGQLQRDAEKLWQEVEAIMTRVPLELTFNDTLNNNNT